MYAVATCGGFTNAAEMLHLTQQAVSFQIKSLEDELGARLIHRDAKSVELTEEGQILVRYAKQILDLYSAAEDEISHSKGLYDGLLRVGCTGTLARVAVPGAIRLFREVHPAVSFTVSISNSEGVLDLLSRSIVDIGIVSAGPVDLEQYSIEKLFDDEVVFIAPADHQFAQRELVTPEELMSEPFVLREVGSGTRRVVGQYLKSLGVEIADFKVVTELGSSEALKAAVAAGIGLSATSSISLLGNPFRPPLAPINLDGPPLNRSFYLVMPVATGKRRVVGAFAKALRAANAVAFGATGSEREAEGSFHLPGRALPRASREPDVRALRARLSGQK
nr:LysR family transcriptional regulator [Bradyrhizobium sp. KB893862 SZCCT0404]